MLTGDLAAPAGERQRAPARHDRSATTPGCRPEGKPGGGDGEAGLADDDHVADRDFTGRLSVLRARPARTDADFSPTGAGDDGPGARGATIVLALGGHHRVRRKD
jgi:hypothetical protein